MPVPRGAYTADRAAALAGVPLSTVHWWSRNDILVPSVSPERVKLWSYADLMGLRTIHWLRQPKKAARDGVDIPRSTMPAVRRALHQLSELDMAVWTEDAGPSVRVDRAGGVHLATQPSLERTLDRQRALPTDEDELDILSPFATGVSKGPDLVEPRPQLRIVPGKLGGSPHVAYTRLESRALGALASSGLRTAKIYTLYPDVPRDAIDAAIDLEHQLNRNLLPIAS